MSTIEWTEQTWNPVTGCTKISPGCKHCYAETMARRLQAMGTPGYRDGFDTITLLPERLVQPLRRKKATTYFVNSMSDVFHENVPDTFLNKLFEVMEKCPQHTFQVLTKRAERLSDYFQSSAVPKNVWLGVSVEDKRYGLPRIALLQKVECDTRFLSVEPLLEDLGMRIPLSGITWVIVGGESGHKARPMKKDWVLRIKQQCEAKDVSFFFKQWGVWGPDEIKRSKRANGRFLEGRTWDSIPTLALT